MKAHRTSSRYVNILFNRLFRTNSRYDEKSKKEEREEGEEGEDGDGEGEGEGEAEG